MLARLPQWYGKSVRARERTRAAVAELRPIKKPLKSITLEQNCTKQQIKAFRSTTEQREQHSMQVRVRVRVSGRDEDKGIDRDRELGFIHIHTRYIYICIYIYVRRQDFPAQTLLELHARVIKSIRSKETHFLLKSLQAGGANVNFEIYVKNKNVIAYRAQNLIISQLEIFFCSMQWNVFNLICYSLYPLFFEKPKNIIVCLTKELMYYNLCVSVKIRYRVFEYT